MMILSNAHTHTNFCDGKNTPAEMAEKAFQSGFVSLGFSVHSPLPYNNDYALPQDRLDEYLREIDRLKLLFKGKMEILSGIELDFDSYLDKNLFDYAIGSVHQIISNNKVYSLDDTPQKLQECMTEVFNGDSAELSKCYFNLVEKHILNCKAEIVGHFDLITKFNKITKIIDTESKTYRDAAITAVRNIIKEHDCVFEINTGAMSRGYRDFPYPAPFILEKIGELGGKVMINSDSHNVDAIDFGFDKAIKICKDCGISVIYRLREKGFEKLVL